MEKDIASAKTKDANAVEQKHENFGKILASLRKQHRDRWYKEWNTERLANESKSDQQTGCLTKQIIANIEAGRRSNLDSDTLARLANGLSLTPLERKDFFYMAIGAEADAGAKNYYSDKDARDVFNTVASMFTPCYVIDQYCDFVACNAAFLKLFGFQLEGIEESKSKPAGLNLLYHILAPESTYRMSLSDTEWKNSALNNIYFFRRITLKYRHTDYFQYLLDALLELDEFKNRWFDSFSAKTQEKSRQHIALTDNNYSLYQVMGHSFIGTVTSIMTKDGELHLVVYTPNSLETATMFSELINHSAREVYFIAPWPEKRVYWKE